MAVITPDLLDFRSLPPTGTERVSAPPGENFHEIYAEHVDLVWRSLRGLGVREASVEDAVQDVFLVIHRRLASFEARLSFRVWLFGIVLRVARNHRRTEQRKGGCASFDTAPDLADSAPGPHEEAASAEALREIALALGDLDELAALHPAGVLREERIAAQVFALCAEGKTEQSREAARRFLAEMPASVQADRVRASCASPPGKHR